jgi:hypothetical protein
MSRKISGPYLFRVVSSYTDFIVYYLFICCLLPHLFLHLLCHTRGSESSTTVDRVVSPVVPLHSSSTNTCVPTVCLRSAVRDHGVKTSILVWNCQYFKIIDAMSVNKSDIRVVYFIFFICGKFCVLFQGSLSVQWKLSFLFWHMENTSYSYYVTNLLEK